MDMTAPRGALPLPDRGLQLRPETRLARAREQMSCTIDREGVVLSLRDGMYYGLNEVGARVWELIEESHSLGEIVAMIAGEFEVGPEQCETDVRRLLAQFHAAGLVEVLHERAR